MRSKLSGVVSLSDCSAPTRDVDGVMFTQCVDSRGGLVRLSTVDAGDETVKAQALADSGWKTATGPGWIVAVNSDQATLDKVKSALS
jgi:hypothetical protein